MVSSPLNGEPVDLPAHVGAPSPEVPTGEADLAELTRRALEARKKNPTFQLRLLTSVGDYFLGSTKAISQAFDEADVFHSLVIVPGDHSYKFNRGPGAYELLMYHDRVLRGRPPV